MGQIKVEKNVDGIEGLCVIEPAVHGDARGYFMETYNEKDMKEAGIDIHFVQDNQSFSAQKGTLRGLHYQLNPKCQAKLLRATRGAIFDVAVDIRKGSPTFGKYVSVELTEDNHRQFFIPRGFAHGFSVLTDEVIFQYKCDNFYAPQSEGALAWDDPDLGIDWRVPANEIVLSEKDNHHELLKDASWLFNYNESLY